MRKLTTEEFITRARLIHGNKYDYSKIEYINIHIKICIICPKHGEFWQTPNKHIIRQHNCPRCLGQNKTHEDVINIFEKRHGNKYDYSKVVYINNKKPVCIICSIHGEFWQTPSNHSSGTNCPKCNISRLESEINQCLLEHDIQFETQKRFDWLGRQSLDFFLPDYNVGVECQGEQHFKPFRYENIDKEFIIRRERDIKKYNLCKENGIKLLYFTEKRFKKYEKDYLGKLFFDKNKLLKEVKLWKK